VNGDVNGGPGPRRLGVLVDGTPLAEAEALALWDRFSLWMEEHRGDLAGFAAKEGFASVHPGVDGDRPVLRASKSATQRAYRAVSAGGDPEDRVSGGSAARQNAPGSVDQRRNKPPKSPEKRRK
jgi:hypothetical protein